MTADSGEVRTFVPGADGDGPLTIPRPAGGSDYREWPPPPALRAGVDRVWSGRERALPSDAGSARVLPDGKAEIVFELDPSGSRERPPRGFLVGGSLSPAVGPLTGPVLRFGVRLTRWTGAPLFGVPACELTDRTVPLDVVWGRSGRELIERVADAPGLGARVSLLCEALGVRMDGAAPDPVVTAALQEIRASRGRLRIRRLAARVSTSERHLQRRFREHVGFTPKQLAGLERFRAAVRSMHREPRRPLHGIAVRCGYYDQPHFVREIRRYSGLTPTTLRSRLAAADPT